MSNEHGIHYTQALVGKMYREVLCPHCKTHLADEFVFRGRIKLRCIKCGKIVVMVFRRPKKTAERSNSVN